MESNLNQPINLEKVTEALILNYSKARLTVQDRLDEVIDVNLNRRDEPDQFDPSNMVCGDGLDKVIKDNIHELTEESRLDETLDWLKSTSR